LAVDTVEHAMPSALITGANRGLGFEFARQYLANGWQIYAACRDPSSASELRRLADTSDHKLRIMALNVNEPASVKAAAAGKQLTSCSTMLVSAGFGARPSENIDYAAWTKVLETNTMNGSDAGFGGVC
jgi:NAD(P)-dependent dehydrogenase (short-subunit alcohol dehydrogenase family)